MPYQDTIYLQTNQVSSKNNKNKEKMIIQQSLIDHQSSYHQDQLKYFKITSFIKNHKRSIIIYLVICIVVISTIGFSIGYQAPKDAEIYEFVVLDINTGGLCLDGSPGAYYLSKHGDPSKVLIFFQAGGWCGSRSVIDRTLEQCWKTSQSQFGSNKDKQNQISYDNPIFGNSSDNYFKDWKRAYLIYCDGSGHQGYREKPVQYKGDNLYFRGHNITIGQLNSLQTKIELFSKAKQVIISGDSAGGLAAALWANYIAERVMNGYVYSIPDSGIFLDAKDYLSKKYLFRKSFINLMKYSNENIDPPVPQCIKRFPNQREKCMFAQNILQDIKVPLFIIQSQYDLWTIRQILGLDCISKQSLSSCNIQQLIAIEEYRFNVKNLIVKTGLRDPQRNGYWSIACAAHGYLRFDLSLSEDHRIPEGSVYSLMDNIENWINFLNSSPSQNVRDANKYIDVQPWPRNKYCSGIL